MRVVSALDLGLVIRDRRRKRGLDQAELAALAGVGRQWIVAVEKGKPRAEIGLLLRTLKALELGVFIEEEEGVVATAAPLVDIDAIVERAKSPR